MLSESGLGHMFWEEAAATSVHLINRSPSSVLEFQVLEEIWTSVMLDLLGMKWFGCVVYVHPDDGKLNPKARSGVFRVTLKELKDSEFGEWMNKSAPLVGTLCSDNIRCLKNFQKIKVQSKVNFKIQDSLTSKLKISASLGTEDRHVITRD